MIAASLHDPPIYKDFVIDNILKITEEMFKKHPELNHMLYNARSIPDGIFKSKIIFKIKIKENEAENTKSKSMG